MDASPVPVFKTCHRCHLPKPIEEFHAHKKGGPPGTICWACEKRYAREHQKEGRLRKRLGLGSSDPLPVIAPPVVRKRCSRCKRIRPAEDYDWGNDGRRLSAVCRHCRFAADKAEHRCTKCGQVKPPEEFYWKINGKRRYTYCKTCHYKLTKVAAKAYRDRNPAWAADYQRARRLGMTIEELHAWEKEVPDRCEICGSTKGLDYDHIHGTPTVRGRLCRGCNNGIGRFRDNPDLLRLAAAYLERALPEWTMKATYLEVKRAPLPLISEVASGA